MAEVDSESKGAKVEDVPGLADADEWMTERQRTTAVELLQLDQGHLFSEWAPGKRTSDRQALLDAVAAACDGYPGGLPAYIAHAQEHLEAAQNGDNPLDGFTPTVPSGVTIESLNDASVDELEAAGVAAFKDCAFCLVAGGLGERLGYSGIKLSLPTTLTTMKCYLQVYIEQILELQARSNNLAGLTGASLRRVPLAIMTSDDTHTATLELLERNSYFGMRKDQITVMKQEKVPALIDNKAHIATSDPYTIVTKPHGHGDVHSLIAGCGLAQTWQDEGRQYLVCFQDTNYMCFDSVPAALGVALQQEFDAASICVPRKAGEAVGAIATLKHEDGSQVTACVEYNQLAPLLVATVNAAGDVNDPATGFSPFPGNINQLLFRIPTYAAVLAENGGLMPEFVNPKYADDTKTVFSSATRLECMMQDYPKLLPASAKVGFATFPTSIFSPVKNSIEGGRSKAKAGLRTQTALAGEFDVYEVMSKRVAALGVDIGEAGTFSAAGLAVERYPALCLPAAMTCTRAVLSTFFPTPADVHISSRSALVVRGGGSLVIKSLRLDGALEVTVPAGVTAVLEGVTVENAGYEFAELTAEALARSTAAGGGCPEYLRIRGFTQWKDAATCIEFSSTGSYESREVTKPREGFGGSL